MALNPQLCETLQEKPLFSGLSGQQFAHIVESAAFLELSSGDVLFRQHDPANDFFLLLTGKIKLSLLSIEGTEKVVDIIHAGNTFAEAIMFKGMAGYPVNAEAVGCASLIKISAQSYIDILKESPEACFKVMSQLSVRIHWLMTELDRLSLHNATYRLISYLMENITDSDTTPAEIQLSIPKHILASRLSITPETFSRTIKRLADKNLLEVHERHIILKDIEALQRMITV